MILQTGLLLVLAGAPGVVIQSSTSEIQLPTRLVSLEFQDADIHAVMRFMAEYGGVNIVLSDDVQGRITVRLKDVPWDQAMQAILASKGLVATTTSGTLLIRPL